MYTLGEYNNLISKYGSFASWAIWDYKNQSDTTVINQNFHQLHSRFVLLALNISNTLIEHPWANFHYGPSNIRKLKFACNDNELRGSYITDLFKNTIEKKSTNVRSLISNNLIEKNVDLFNQEMGDIKIDNNTKFIIWGVPNSDLAKYFNKYFKQKYKNPVIYHNHYSYYGITDREWVNSFWGKLNIKQDYDLTIKKYTSS